MSKKFQPLDYSRGWDDYWRDHPQGYSPQEQMVNWAGQLNAMIDFFNEYFDVDLAEYATDVMEGWYVDGRLVDIINEALFDSKADKTTVNALIAKTMTVVDVNKQFGAIADGVADDSVAIQSAINYAIANNIHAVVFEGKYMHKSKILVHNFDKLHLITNNCEFIDFGEEVPNADGAMRIQPVGFEFENFNDLKIDKFTISTTANFTGWYNGRLLSPSDANPVFSIDSNGRKGNVSIGKISLKWQGGAYVEQTKEVTLKEAFGGAFVRITNCNKIDIFDAHIHPTTGYTEIFCIGDCNFLHVHGLFYRKVTEVQPVSVFKCIRVDKQIIEGLDVVMEGNEADFGDFSAKDFIIIRDSFVDYPDGDRFEITSEWKHFNIDIGNVLIENVTGRSRDVNTTQAAHDPIYDNTIKSMTIRNCDIESIYVASNFYCEKTTFENCNINLLQYPTGVPQYGIRTYGETKFKNCNVKTEYGFSRFYVRADQRHLVDNKGKLIIEDCTIDDFSLFTLASDTNDNIDVKIINTELKYNGLSPYGSTLLSNRINKLTFDQCKIHGDIHNRYLITDNTSLQNFIKELEITNCDIDIISGGVSAYIIKLVMGDFQEESVYNINNNKFGDRAQIIAIEYSLTSLTGSGGCMLVLENNKYMKIGTSTFDMVGDVGGYLDNLDFIFKNNLFNGIASSVRLGQIEAKARNYINSNNIELNKS